MSGSRATNSRNSSTPPSADPHRPPAKKPATGKKRGAQPGHAGKARVLLPPDQVTEAHDCRPSLCSACGGRVRNGTLRRELFDFQVPFLRHRIETLLHEGAACRHAGTARTCRNILNLRDALWTFLDTPGVEPTNNHAERTLRRFVLWRKISFGTQPVRGSRYVERIMTVAGSCRLQGRNVLDFLTQAIDEYVTSLLQQLPLPFGHLVPSASCRRTVRPSP